MGETIDSSKDSSKCGGAEDLDESAEELCSGDVSGSSVGLTARGGANPFPFRDTPSPSPRTWGCRFTGDSSEASTSCGVFGMKLWRGFGFVLFGVPGSLARSTESGVGSGTPTDGAKSTLLLTDSKIMSVGRGGGIFEALSSSEASRNNLESSEILVCFGAAKSITFVAVPGRALGSRLGAVESTSRGGAWPRSFGKGLGSFAQLPSSSLGHVVASLRSGNDVEAMLDATRRLQVSVELIV
ncbi:hypothetical protein B0T17DRAFT_639545 [Bombardia bombarda]|uniref:Uncharacterized protein n=1 Tax=Bombardia bombarda TaxID=252184 RepID=A0AA40C4V7_9PEZI|nr:hypothetical protein B0T17DRAFT_639545 [Bombardia bombarda]